MRTKWHLVVLAAVLSVVPTATAASRSKGKKVGHDAGVCTFTSLAPPEAACNITFFLPRGQIATQFLNAPPPHKVTAIVGGTGAYRGTRGEAVIVERPNQTGTITFRLTR